MPDSPTSESKAAFVCDCEEQNRSACVSEPFHKKYNDKSYCALHFPGEDKAEEFRRVLQRKLAKKDFNFRGAWFPNELSLANFRFSSEVDFSYATFTKKVNFGSAVFGARSYFRFVNFNSEADFRLARFKGDTNFYSARFATKGDFAHASFSKEANFDETTFKAEVTFAYTSFQGQVQFRVARFDANARFTSITFGAEVTFNSAEFGREADFSLSQFCEETDFSSAILGIHALFRKVRFKDRVDFSYAMFNGDADFASTVFAGRSTFSFAIFNGYLSFVGESNEHLNTTSLDFHFAKIERADRVVFHSQSLRPHWFVNIDPRRFNLTNINWGWNRVAVRRELYAIEQKNVLVPHKMLAITCAQLAANAEENHRYEEASDFRYMAMEARRRETWRGFAPWRLSWWYWVASGYGERVLKAFLVLLGIWFVAGLLYTLVGFARWEPKLATEADIVAAKRDEVGAPLKFSRALTYSAGVMTFQRPEPRPATTAAQTVVLLETILGPVQAALLALAIRRKFMR